MWTISIKLTAFVDFVVVVCLFLFCFVVVVVLRKRLAEAGSNLGFSVYQPGSTVEKNKLTENHSVYNLK